MSKNQDDDKKLSIQTSEGDDGSATITIPENELPEDDHDDGDDRREKDDRLAGSVRDDDDHDDDGDAGSDDPQREAIRQARREERKLKKQIHKEKARESNHLINMLKRQNEQMAQRVAELERRSAGADSARLDKAIEDGQLRLQYAKMKIAEATKAGNGEALVEAQEAWYEARRQVEALEATKKRASSTDSSGVPRAPDPRLKKHASDWMARNDWYDPEGRDVDSKITVKLDEALVEEGWDPTTQEYWEELDARVSKYLPHRASRRSDDGDDGDGEFRSQQQQRRTRPRSPVGSSGRDNQGGSNNRAGEFRLSPDRVKAIKDAGKWDDPVERQKMARRYAEYDRAHNIR